MQRHAQQDKEVVTLMVLEYGGSYSCDTSITGNVFSVLQA